jgi:DNA-binding CsgD family transcriptional regulator/tetratricopeptide (TPR) repeat protein
MELLERDAALAALAEAYDEAVRGTGRVVYVTGEPGIGKTSLVTRFVQDLTGGTRVLFGTCDDLSIPRPLGPIRDLAGSVSAGLEGALSSGAAPHEVQTLLVAELELPPQPTVLVLEDVHWADDATLDAITVLGRRIGGLPALLVLTFRAGEVPPGHPLHATVGAIRADDSVVLELGPLSKRAVASLAGPRAAEVFAATGGNPFYVNELVCATAPRRIPRTVANAVLGRAARLESADRRLIELVSVVPGRVRASVLDAVMPDWPAAAEEPERRQLLEIDSAHVRFRHELARHAIRSSIPAAACRRLHGEILEALLVAGADPADIVHHAEAAGSEDVVADYALVAARRAGALESNREAYSQYRRALQFIDRLPPAEQAHVLEEVALAGYTVGRLEEALPAIESAIAIYGELAEAEAVGRSTRILSRLYWFAGDGAPAIAKAHEAVEILEPLGESSELARAYSAVSQLAMLSEDGEQALLWGERAIRLATSLGDEATLAHALVNIGTSRNQLDPDGDAELRDAHRIADAAGNWEEGSRALTNLAFTHLYWARPEQALRYAEQGLAYSEEHDLQNFASYTAMILAWLRLRSGEWDEAERLTNRQLEWGSSVPQLLARTVLAELAVRRGDPDAPELLADLAVQADRAGDLQRLTPVLELSVESALTTGSRMPVERIELLLAELRERGIGRGWGSVRISAWAAVAGIEPAAEDSFATPYSAMARRDWGEAADAFGRIGWGYDRALMLSLLDDEESLVESLELARGLGAMPLVQRATTRLRDLGLRVPHGPREATRSNPAGLTARQLEVLELLVDGLTNAEIADRLFLSQRTAEHHVAAVLAKLGAPSRREAARRASELRLVTR